MLFDEIGYSLLAVLNSINLLALSMSKEEMIN
jgi:hypothetical protein